MAKLTPYRAEVLWRLAEADPDGMSIPDASNGHPNIMPTLVAIGWAKFSGRGNLYVITRQGAIALAGDPHDG